MKKKLIVAGKAYLQPITIKGHKIATIDRNKAFFAPPREIRRQWDSILKNSFFMQKYLLNDNDKKQLNALYPGFVFNQLAMYFRLQNTKLDEFGKNDITLMQRTEYNKIPYVEMEVFSFFISNNTYRDWLNTPFGILCHPVFRKIPFPLTECEKLFDKNVLPIKKLVKDIGDLSDLTIKETKNFYLYDDSNLISNTFFTELNKKIQCYDYISLLYNNSKKYLVNSKNRLKFNVLTGDQREHLTLQLEDNLTPKKLK